MRVDPRHWNLLATTAFAGLAACGIPTDLEFFGDGGDDGESSSASRGSDDGGDDGYCDEIDDPALRCSCGAELDPSIRCGYYDDDWGDGDGDGDGDCDPLDCYFPLDCSPGANNCQPSPEILDCKPERTVELIPLEELPLAHLEVVRREAGTPDELVIITADYFWRRVDGVLTEHARVPGAGSPVDTFVGDIDDDGRTELLISDEFNEVREIDLGSLSETTQWFKAGATTRGALESGGSPRYVTTLDGVLSVRNDSFETQHVTAPDDPWSYSAVDSATNFSNLGETFATVVGEYSHGFTLLSLEHDVDTQLDWNMLETAHLAESMSAAVARLDSTGPQQVFVAVAGMGVGTKLKILRRDESDPRFHGMLPGELTARPPVVQRDLVFPRVILIGHEEAAVVLVDPDLGLACQQALPALHEAVSIDLDGDGDDELIVASKDGTIAQLIVE